jgi:hypothetical protein
LSQRLFSFLWCLSDVDSDRLNSNVSYLWTAKVAAFPELPHRHGLQTTGHLAHGQLAFAIDLGSAGECSPSQSNKKVYIIASESQWDSMKTVFRWVKITHIKLGDKVFDTSTVSGEIFRRGGHLWGESWKSKETRQMLENQAVRNFNSMQRCLSDDTSRKR